jgi:hypothetical protein
MKFKLFVVSGLAGLAVLWSQVVGASISGTVRDETGAGVGGANVLVRNVETGAVRNLVTDNSGRYSAPSIAIGRYELSASKPGFNTQVRTGIDLVVGKRRSWT